MARHLLTPDAVYDSALSRLVEACAVLVEDEMIVDVGTEAEIAARHPLDGSETRDLAGLLLFPGLINTHVHFVFDGTKNARQTYLDETPEQRIARAFANAETMVRSGVTTARDCGSCIPSMVALLEAAKSRRAVLPNLVMCGPPITGIKGHLFYMGGEAETSADIEALVDTAHQHGARSAKVMATGGQMTPGTRPEVPVFETAELQALVVAARARDMSTVSHCLSAEGTIRSAEAGFDSIEHCAFFERTPEDWMERVYRPEVTEAILKSGASVMMGLAASTNALNRVRETGEGTEHEKFRLAQERRMLEIFSTMRTEGVPMICGTDAGTADTPFDETWKELELMVGTGMNVPEAIWAATLGAAHAMRIDTVTGAIRPGLRADLIGLAENPLSRVAAFAEIDFIMVAGRDVQAASTPAQDPIR